MLVLLMSVATAATMPTKPEPLGDPASWVNASDIPKSEWQRAVTTTYDLTIDARGKPIRCEVTTPSGSDATDTVVCNSLMKNARSRAAKDISGQPIISVARGHVQWHPDSSAANQYVRDSPDIIASTSLISSRSQVELVKTIETIGPSGRVESCQLIKKSKIDALNSEACSIVERSDVSPPIKDAAGSPVAGVRSFYIDFVSGDDGKVYVR